MQEANACRGLSDNRFDSVPLLNAVKIIEELAERSVSFPNVEAVTNSQAASVMEDC